jgi:regulatory protein
MAVVTGLRERRRGRVEVELDGAPWRVVPVDAVVRAELRVGRPLDRETARTLGRELRRSRALDVAAQALRHRDHSRRSLEERLARRNVGSEATEATLAALERTGLVDDARVASSRAVAMADRGYGDAAIRFDLERQGLAGELVEDAVAGLVPERERAKQLVERRGAEPKTSRWLAGRGFDPASVEDAMESFAADR